MALVTTQTDGNIAIVTMDDGKANALSATMMSELETALSDAADAEAVVLLGRPGKFCAGFDLKVMMQGPDQACELVALGGEFLMKLYEFPKPFVAACTGHALAGGALVLTTADERVGVRGDFKIGLNEVKAGMPVPILAHRLAADRLDPRAYTRAVLQAELYNPDGAKDVGFLDHVVDGAELLPTAVQEAKRLAQLPASAYAKSKESLRRQTLRYVRETLQQDLKDLLGS